MKYKGFINTVSIAKDIINNFVQLGSTVLDCTVGNGNDTLLLANRVGSNGKVYGFDIQEIAINNTRDLLKRNNLLERVELIQDSNENIDLYINEKLDFIIYNLGYLPRGNKDIKTTKETTLNSLKKSLYLLSKNGILLITSYVGHEGGMEEKDGVEELLSSLDQKEFNVIKFDFINQINNPPILYGVEKSF